MKFGRHLLTLLLGISLSCMGMLREAHALQWSHIGNFDIGLTFRTQAGQEIANPDDIDYEDVTNLPNGFLMMNHKFLLHPHVSGGLHFSTFNRGLYVEAEVTNSDAENTDAERIRSVEKTYLLLGPMASYYTLPYRDSGHFLSVNLSSGLCIERLFFKTTQSNTSQETDTNEAPSDNSSNPLNIASDSILIEGYSDTNYKAYLSTGLSYSLRLAKYSLLQLSYHQMIYLFPFETHGAISLGVAYEIRYGK